MEEKTLLILAIILFCFGVSMLYLIYSNTEVAEVKDISNYLGNTVKVRGSVIKTNYKEGVTILASNFTNFRNYPF